MEVKRSLMAFFPLFFISVTNISSTASRASIWESYKDSYGKIYASVSENIFRKQIFTQNLLAIKRHNRLYAMGKTYYKKGVNQFSDKSNDEIAKKTLSYIVTNKFARQNNLLENSYDAIVGNGHRSVPKQKDWRKRGIVTSVKNQGDCASCWAFSAAGALEGLFALKNISKESISAQNLVDCTNEYGNNGCKGGNTNRAFKYVYNNEGVAIDRKYSYEGKERPCRYDPQSSAGFLTKLKIIPRDGNALRHYVANYGPCSVAVDATNLHAYEQGIYSDPDCDAENVNHAVLVVGYGTDKKTGIDYWLIKNSWGEKWGENGYFRLLRDKENHCGITTDASVPIAAN